MISLSYKAVARRTFRVRSRISSPLAAFQRNPAFPASAEWAPKNLTLGIQQLQNRNYSDSVRRAFPACYSDFDPVFPHLSDLECPKSLPKNLTFGAKQVI